ncbi:M56 family metallopeptidase [Lacinutrix sp. MedPE-SW]|uniref:M56 family metallopeptidase n=1 Tax=Lacinutrix sp. MedPE-SW TaxID=1860087 RepID=UPI00091D8C6C|nr:M56 family metallopeptidase [Lacinutrix sp. MedPE-SW]OIQ20355.1 MAG: hypothetical protein BM549_10570 [Lacinutrix sp. MedPE-SW]
MEILILKSTACLAILLAFYKLFLERLNIHTFKRFYLLGAVLISIIIPFIPFIEYIEPQFNVPYFEADHSVPINLLPEEENLPVEPTNYLPIILWSIYGLGVLLFLTKFCINLFGIVSKIKRNEKQKSGNYISVLVQDFIVPHTFFSYIFLNKTRFEAKAIPQEVLLHEQTHAKQKHTLDILFIELLQVVFWFNPLLYLLKKDIKLNHEFLADEAVLKQGIDSSTYQETLLQFSSTANEIPLAHAINYSLIKKRFTIMKTQTSKKAVWLRSFLLLPLLAGLLFSFSGREQVEKEVVPAMVFPKEIENQQNKPLKDVKTELQKLGDYKINYTARSITVKVLSQGNYEIDGIKATKNTFKNVINQLHQDITKEIRDKIINIHVNSPKDISDKEVWFIFNAVQDYGYHRIVAYNQEIIRSKNNTPFALDNVSNNNANYSANKSQKEATPEQVAEYNKLAKYYNAKLKVNTIVKLKDFNRIKELYNLMSDAQKKNAEPFPNFPPPPAPPAPPKEKKGEVSTLPPPPAPPAPPIGRELERNTAFVNVNGTTLFKVNINGDIKYYNRNGYIVDSTGKVLSKSQVDGSKVIPGQKITKVYQKGNIVAEFKKTWKDDENFSVPKPPKPPKPISPEKHIKNMASKDASFFYNGDAVTKEKALELIKDNNKINISTQTNNGVSTVHLSTKPITIVNGKRISESQKNRDKAIAKRRALTEERKNAMLEKRKALRQKATTKRQQLLAAREARQSRPLAQQFKGMEANGGAFFYEGEKITEAKAIELITDNPKLNVSMHNNNGKSTVHLSKKGIKTVNGKLVKTEN